MPVLAVAGRGIGHWALSTWWALDGAGQSFENRTWTTGAWEQGGPWTGGVYVAVGDDPELSFNTRCGGGVQHPPGVERSAACSWRRADIHLLNRR